MTNTLRGLMAAAVIGGASLSGAATLPANDAHAASFVTVKKAETTRLVVRRGDRAQLIRLSRQIRALKAKRRALIVKIGGLRSGRMVATHLYRGNCRVVSNRLFRARLARAVRAGRMSRARARLELRNARIKSSRCQRVLQVEVRRTSVRIARLQRAYRALVRRRG